MKFPPPPRLERIEHQNVSVSWLGDQGDQISQQTAALSSRIEKFALQQLSNPRLGRGSKLELAQRPLQDVSKPWLWKRGGQSFWGQVAVRLQQLPQHPKGHSRTMRSLENLGKQMRQHWIEGIRVAFDGFFMLFGMLWSNHGEEHRQVLLRFTRQQLAEHQKLAHDQETEEYRTWMLQAQGKGCRGLFRSIKRDELLTNDLFRISQGNVE